MSKLKSTLGIVAIAFITLTAVSCKDNKKEHDNSDGHHDTENTEHNGMADDDMMDNGQMGNPDKMAANNPGNKSSDAIIDNYLKIKNALVADDRDAAAEAGSDLMGDFNDFDKSGYSSEEQQELTDIIEDAKEHAEHISESPIEHQREHFDILSKDVIDMIGITGTSKKLYQDFCPMYNDNKGAQWLSASKEIKNPYYGSKMIDCGEVQKEIN